MNFQAGFKCTFQAYADKEYTLKITGATLYAIYLNNEFIFYGPARAPHGYLRVDEVPLQVHKGENTLCISVAGLNCRSFYTRNMKSFVQAEILVNDSIVAYTGRDFKGISLDGIKELIFPVLGEPTEQITNALGGVTVKWDFEAEEKIISVTALAANRENGLLWLALALRVCLRR